MADEGFSRPTGQAKDVAMKGGGGEREEKKLSPNDTTLQGCPVARFDPENAARDKGN